MTHSPQPSLPTQAGTPRTPMTLSTGPNHPDFRMLDAAPGRRMSSQSIGIAIALNLAILLLAFRQLHHPQGLPLHPVGAFLSNPLTVPPSLLKFKTNGGGGSNSGATPVSLGNPPKYDAQPIIPLTAARIVHPPLAVDPAINVRTDIGMTNPNLTTMGLLNGAAMPNASPGNNGGPGIGNGSNGSGTGDGGPSGTGIGNRGLNGGRTIAPQVLFAPEPEFSELARKNHISGNVLVALTIDANGRPTDIRVVRGLGSGLDEKAIEAVSRYCFKPAMQNGHPVPVAMNVNVDFQIF